MNLLLVDDEVSLLSLLGQFLVRQGHHVETAASAAAARAAIEAFEDFDVAVIDLALPDGNGIDLAAALLGRSSKLRVVVASGYSLEPELVPAAIRARVRLLQKPFLPKALGRMLEDWTAAAPSV